MQAPEHGNVRCTRSRHLSQHFYRTRCSFWCNEGYTLIGTSTKHCNGSDGIWDATETLCIREYLLKYRVDVKRNLSNNNNSIFNIK